jgi:hypothetical protein
MLALGLLILTANGLPTGVQHHMVGCRQLATSVPVVPDSAGIM